MIGTLVPAIGAVMSLGLRLVMIIGRVRSGWQQRRVRRLYMSAGLLGRPQSLMLKRWRELAWRRLEVHVAGRPAASTGRRGRRYRRGAVLERHHRRRGSRVRQPPIGQRLRVQQLRARDDDIGTEAARGSLRLPLLLLADARARAYARPVLLLLVALVLLLLATPAALLGPVLGHPGDVVGRDAKGLLVATVAGAWWRGRETDGRGVESSHGTNVPAPIVARVLQKRLRQLAVGVTAVTAATAVLGLDFPSFGLGEILAADVRVLDEGLLAEAATGGLVLARAFFLLLGGAALTVAPVPLAPAAALGADARGYGCGRRCRGDLVRVARATADDAAEVDAATTVEAARAVLPARRLVPTVAFRALDITTARHVTYWKIENRDV